MMMKMLEAGGMPLIKDGIRSADEDNPKGYFEDERVKNLADEPDKSWLMVARGKGIKIISHLLKELPTSHNYQVIFMQRNLEEILASQAKMLERRGESSQSGDSRMRELFEADLWRCRSVLKRRQEFDVLDVNYKEVIGDAVAQARRVDEFLGRALDVEAMARVVDRQLYRNRS
jgi:hypothetical protein